ncbi:MAG: hypothetical protein WAX69_03600 [Victivallales bacterium]
MAIEVKGSQRIHDGDMRHLRMAMEDNKIKHPVAVTFETARRKTHDGITVYPYRQFLDDLWDGKLV